MKDQHAAVDALVGMMKRLQYEADRLGLARQGMERLAEFYYRYLEFQDEVAGRKEKFAKLAGMLADSDVVEKDTLDGLVADCLGPFETVERLRQELTIKDAISLLLEAVGPTSITQVLGFLEMIGLPATRQSLESAIKKNPSIFRVRKSGKTRVIALTPVGRESSPRPRGGK